VFGQRILCQQGVNAGMSQQDEDGQRSKGMCKKQEVGRGQVFGIGESSKRKHGQYQQSRKSSSK
jgi:hypothetical protein